MDIKIIGLDLDGTLLKEDKTIDAETKQVLEALGKKGIQILPITGRPYSGVPKNVMEIQGIRYVIANNGSQIIDAKNQKSLYDFSMSNEITNATIDLVASFNVKYEVFCDHYGYCEPNVYEYFKETYQGSPLGDYIFSSRKCIPSIKEHFSNKSKQADEVFVICSDSKEREKIIKKLAAINGIQCCLLADRFLEITKLGTNKGTALEVLCRHLGISLKNTIAFGDGENDIEFLEKAGISVVMGNARDKVKEKADIVTDTNENNGVLKILKKYI